MFDAAWWALFGLIMGSFTNVLILRHGSGESINGRSHCAHCKTTLRWFELVPVVSWIMLRGRCRSCRAWISVQYPLVELLTGGLILALGLAPIPLVQKLIGIPMVILLVAIAVYDLYHTIIPDRWVFPFVALSFVWAMLSGGWSWATIVAGPATALPLFLLWLVSHGRWMGLGDAKLALGFGWLLGLVPGIFAVGFSFVIGATVGVGILLPLPHIVQLLAQAGITRSAKRAPGYTMKSEVPFGPFLILSLCIVWFSALYGFDFTAAMMQALVWSN